MTDYDNYAAVWSCHKVFMGHRESAQIMSRTPKLDLDVIRKLRTRFENFGIDEHYFSVVDQSDCNYKDASSNSTEHEDVEKFALQFGPLKIKS